MTQVFWAVYIAALGLGVATIVHGVVVKDVEQVLGGAALFALSGFIAYGIDTLAEQA